MPPSISIHRHFLTLMVITTIITIAAILAFASSYWLVKNEIQNDSQDLIMFLDGRLQAAYQNLQRLDQIPFQECNGAGRELLKEFLFDTINGGLFLVRNLDDKPLHYCSVVGNMNFDPNATGSGELLPVPNLERTNLLLGEYEWQGQLRRDLFMVYQGRQVNLRRLPLMENYPFYEAHLQGHRRVHMHLSNDEMVMELGSFNQQELTIVSVESDQFPFKVTAVVSPQRVLTLSRYYFVAFLLLLTIFVLLLRHSYKLRVQLRQSLIYRLQDAVAQRQLQAYYQPIINASTQRIVAAEALIRWITPEGEVILPNSFIAELEQSTLINEVTQQIIIAMPKDLAAVLTADSQFRCGVNLIAEQIESPICVDWLTQLVAEGYPCQQLALEITERSPIYDMANAKLNLERFRALGCWIELDDAGTGYGGASYVQQLPLDVMKIDKLFIDTLGLIDTRTQVLDAYVNMARSLNLEVIAEGVEFLAQSQALLARGVQLQQGYLFAKPMPAKEFVNFWHHWQTQANSNTQSE